MKRIFIALIAVLQLVLISCEVEKIQPNEITDTITPPVVIEPEVVYTPPPCESTLDSNKYRFNNAVYYANVERDSSSYAMDMPNCNNATYLIKGTNWSNNNTIEFYFIGKPKTGIYTTVATNSLPEGVKNNVCLVISPSYGQTYYATVGASVYVKNNGTSIKVSFCNTPFKYYADGFTVNNNFGELVSY